MEKAHECSKKILMLMEKEGRPGTLCSDLYYMAVEEARSNGFGDVFMGYGDSQAKFVGHGVGLEIDDLPLLSHNFKSRLQQGMVIAIEPKFVFPELGVVGLEDVYEVTSSGLNRLTLTDQKIIYITPEAN
jgi:Xaa-Pro aminopeptidase